MLSLFVNVSGFMRWRAPGQGRRPAARPQRHVPPPPAPREGLAIALIIRDRAG
jgi:hypothetical protein